MERAWSLNYPAVGALLRPAPSDTGMGLLLFFPLPCAAESCPRCLQRCRAQSALVYRRRLGTPLVMLPLIPWGAAGVNAGLMAVSGCRWPHYHSPEAQHRLCGNQATSPTSPRAVKKPRRVSGYLTCQAEDTDSKTTDPGEPMQDEAQGAHASLPRAGAAFEAQTPSTLPGCTLSQHPQLLLRLGWRNHQSPRHTVPNPPAPQVFFRDHQTPGAALPAQVTVTLWAPRRIQQLKGRARNPTPPSQLPHNPMHGKETKKTFFIKRSMKNLFINFALWGYMSISYTQEYAVLYRLYPVRNDHIVTHIQLQYKPKNS